MANNLTRDNQIEEEKPEDISGIRTVNLLAFESNEEADVVDRLRQTCAMFISLVAKHKERIVGHILFTPAQIVSTENETIEGMGLAPLAVLPEYHGQGIGSELCRRGIQKIEALGYPFVIVLGHPGFYSRVGFEPAKQRGITCEYQDAPKEAFMIRVFDAEFMQNVIGTAYYRPEFGGIT